jgi:hypothetical protein
MSWIYSFYVAFLFFILTPAILVRLPPKAGKFTVAGFHAVVFALVLHFTGKMVWNLCRSLEGFEEGMTHQATVTGTSGRAYKFCRFGIGNENGTPIAGNGLSATACKNGTTTLWTAKRPENTDRTDWEGWGNDLDKHILCGDASKKGSNKCA